MRGASAVQDTAVDGPGGIALIERVREQLVRPLHVALIVDEFGEPEARGSEKLVKALLTRMRADGGEPLKSPCECGVITALQQRNYCDREFGTRHWRFLGNALYQEIKHPRMLRMIGRRAFHK